MSESNDGQKDAKRKLPADQDDRSSHSEKKRRKKDTKSAGSKARPKHYPLSERQQLALLMQMTASENTEQTSNPPSAVKKTPSGSGRKDKVNKRNERGETPLHLATIRGELPLIMDLIKQGADINVQDYAGWTPLHEACNHGFHDIAKFLLEAGATVNSKGLDNDYPLHDAVINEHVDLVELLLKHGANPLLSNKHGERPLDMTENEEILRMMQSEIISSDESERTFSPAPLTVENQPKPFKADEKSSRTRLTSDSDQSDKSKPKSSKASTSTASRELFKQFNTKKLLSSSDSDDSEDNIPLSHRKKSLGISHPKNSILSSFDGQTSTSFGFGNNKLKSSRKQKRLFSTESSDSTDSEKKSHRFRPLPDFKQNRKPSLSSDDEMSSSRSQSLHKPNEKLNFKDIFTSRKSSTSTMLKTPSTLGSESKPEEPDVYDFSPNADDFLSESDGISLKPENRSLSKWDNLATSKSKFSKQTSPFSRKPSSLFTSKTDVKKHQRQNEDHTRLKEAIDMDSEKDEKRTVLIKPVMQYTHETSEMMFDRLFKSPEKDKESTTTHEKVFEPVKIEGRSSCNPTISKPLFVQATKSLNQPIAFTSTVTLQTKSLPTFGTFLSSAAVSTTDRSKTFSPSFPFSGRSFVASSEVNVTKLPAVKVKTPPTSSNVNVHAAISLSCNSDIPKSESSESASCKLPILDINENKVKPQTPEIHFSKIVYVPHSSTLQSCDVKAEEPSKPPSLERKIETKLPQSDQNSELCSPMEIKTLKKLTKTEFKEKLSKTFSDPVKKPSIKPSMKDAKSVSVDSKKIVQPPQKISSPSKRDLKNEQKKISLTSAKESNFLNDIESISRQRMKDKQSKLKRKKLLQQRKNKQSPTIKLDEKKPLIKPDVKLSDTDAWSSAPNDKCKLQHKPQFQRSVSKKGVEVGGDMIASLVSSQKDDVLMSPLTCITPSKEDVSLVISQDLVEERLDSDSWLDTKSTPVTCECAASLSHEESALTVTDGTKTSVFCSTKPHPSTSTLTSLHAANTANSYSGSSTTFVSSSSACTPLVFIDASTSLVSSGISHVGEPIPAVSAAFNTFASIVNTNGATLSTSSTLSSIDNLHTSAEQNSVSFYPLLPENHQVEKDNQAFFCKPSTVCLPEIVPVNTEGVIIPVISKNMSEPTHNFNPLRVVTTTTSTLPPVVCSTGSQPVAIAGTSATASLQDLQESLKFDQSDVTRFSEDESNSEMEKQTAEKNVDLSSGECAKSITDEEKMLQDYIQQRVSLAKILFETKRKKLPVYIPRNELEKKKDPAVDKLNVYEERAAIQKQMYEKRKKITTVIPQAPQYYWEYMTFTGGYLLNGSRESHLSVPVLAPPPSLCEPMIGLFNAHEEQRVRLRVQHAIQREKLIMSCEQEIMRVHCRAARTVHNQQVPFSACAVLMDNEVYNMPRTTSENEVGKPSIRDRYNARMFISWLQDVDDKYEKMKSALLARQKHEAEAMFAVQKTEWILKRQEVEHSQWTVKLEDVNEVYVPIVNIADDFDLLPA
ncbi:unnamed protein product [Clavelina lepadiformis]|uniref:Ankyrin repeat domain-containing protein 12 n=2 Tax=Clavelina lepadiformis TaxID=159417 RepID=A0ABP0FU63_CLALP